MKLDDLFDRNVALAMERRRRDPTYFQRLAEQQSPKYLWIGCSDSRVTATDILGLHPGEMFVHRNIANVVHTSDMNLLAVLEYAIDFLKVERGSCAATTAAGASGGRSATTAPPWSTIGCSRS